MCKSESIYRHRNIGETADGIVTFTALYLFCFYFLVLYHDARNEGGRGVLQGAVFLPFKLPDSESCNVFTLALPVRTWA